MYKNAIHLYNPLNSNKIDFFDKFNVLVKTLNLSLF
jgi:hypothetical protein